MTENKQAKNLPGRIMMRTEMLFPDQKVDLRGLRYDIAKYVFAAEFIKDKVILDVACGSGYGSRFLSDNGAQWVAGGDLSTKALAAAQKSYSGKGVQFFMVNATRLPFADSSFDVVVSMETIEHLERFEDYLAECKRVLKKEGIFICSTPCMDFPTLTGDYHVHEFTLDEFQGLLSRFFVGTRFYGQEPKNGAEKRKERIRWEVERMVLKPLKTRVTVLFRLVRRIYHFYIRLRALFRSQRVQLSRIEDWGMILGEEHQPYPLDEGSLPPKTMIAVGRK